MLNPCQSALVLVYSMFEICYNATCLEQHSIDQGLESSIGYINDEEKRPQLLYLGCSSPCYRVCAFANRQYDFGL